MTIGEALKSRRLHARMSQTEMAAGIVSESFYSKVERGVHAIDAETLIKILSVHHFDVTGFFAQINNQSSTGPFFELTSEITFAQNRRDVKALDKIKRKIENGEVQAPLWLKFKLELAYAWALR
ncbi:MAG: helix-turn-helix domain-containing protein [Lactobacillus gallinarum]|jgi:transcriptional regulator with XRE-family HTH domain|uniref:helix-turn-helix domain-containing protein n=1 Tax=Lactobacillus gallinarum TaxID=52242 RepID=UPI00258CE43A|nr:helix-turn-helix transcriptional regulator [uncultured Lactobacillus sp.]